MKLGIFLALILPVAAHHGQDFLVTLDTGKTSPGDFRASFGGEYSEYSSDYEASVTQALVIGLPYDLTFAPVIRLSDSGTGSWDSLSVAPALQWNLPRFPSSSRFQSLSFAVALGWEIPLEDGHNHANHSTAPLADCSSLIAIPPLYQACQLANQNAQNHTHGNDGHAHQGIHRHGQSHGFLRLISEWNPTPHDRFAFNTITVFPEKETPQYGYALAYRRMINSHFYLGFEAIGDVRPNGEHLAYLTTTIYPTHHLSITLGAAAGLTPDSPDLSLQTLLTWRF